MMTDEFVLSLRLGSEVVQLKLRTGEDREAVFQKLTEVQPGCEGRKEEVLAKLVATLQHMLTQQNITLPLHNRIVRFLRNAFPKLPLPQHTAHKPPSINFSKDNVSGFTPQKSSQKPLQVNQSINKPVRQTTRETSKKSGKKTVQNPDLVKAYQNIVKKTHHADMRQMAKDFLRQQGLLKQEKEVSTVMIGRSSLQITQQPTQSHQTQPSQITQESKATPADIRSRCTTQKQEERSTEKISKYHYLEEASSMSLNKSYGFTEVIENSPVKARKFKYLYQ